MIRRGWPSLVLLGVAVVGRVLSEEAANYDKQANYVIVDPGAADRANFRAIAQAKAQRDGTKVDEALDELFDLNPGYDRKLLDGIVDPTQPNDPDALKAGTLIKVNDVSNSLFGNEPQPAQQPQNVPVTPIQPTQVPTSTVPVQPPKVPVIKPILVTVDGNRRETATLQGIADSNMQSLLNLTAPALAAARQQDGNDRVANQALAQLFNLNPRFDRRLMDGVASAAKGDPDTLLEGWQIKVGETSS